MLRLLGRALLASAREIVALTRQSRVMIRDLSPRMPEGLRAGDDLVVLLHGLFATAGAMAYLRGHIEGRTRARTASFSFLPASDVRRLADRLAHFLSGVPAGVRIHLLGHSLGGVVARYYVQVSPTDPRVVQTISLAAPFGGSRVAELVPRWLAGELDRGSPILELIERCWSTGARVPHTSFVASHDQWVVPADSAAYAHGEVVRMDARGHNTLLFDEAVAERIVACIERAQAAAAPTAAV